MITYFFLWVEFWLIFFLFGDFRISQDWYYSIGHILWITLPDHIKARFSYYWFFSLFPLFCFLSLFSFSLLVFFSALMICFLSVLWFSSCKYDKRKREQRFRKKREQPRSLSSCCHSHQSHHYNCFRSCRHCSRQLHLLICFYLLHVLRRRRLFLDFSIQASKNIQTNPPHVHSFQIRLHTRKIPICVLD